MISKNRLAVAAIGAGLVTSLLGMGAAQADPSGAPSPRALVGVGSDTTQDVMNQLSTDVQIGGVKQMGSFNATGSATFNTGKSGCSAVARPNGSGAGRTALLNSLNANGGAGDGCLQFSRSSSLNIAASTPSLTYVPFAIDAVTFAITGNSNLLRSYTLSDLQLMYHCDASFAGITPILPQAGSGTRSYWEGQMNILDTDVNNNVYPCIINGTKNGQPIEEHTGTALDANSIEPFSIAQYNSQANGTIIDRRGSGILGQINGVEPQQANSGFPVKRDVYNVIPTSQIANDPYKTVFVGSSSLVCQQSGDITKYGFAVNPNCGSTTNHS